MMEAISNLREATQSAIDAIEKLQSQLAAQQSEIARLKRQVARSRSSWPFKHRPTL